ncbi:MAG: UDP-N-acetylmuramoyl-tripeptide--D-alanyl-D-alanine ligase [Patescibacteria group bacterium]|nr:UDP-N-acetylmuramoyl-tripeptide--D-alanyl-D-alanine ligase [Patescibacteria group bacterium]
MIALKFILIVLGLFIYLSKVAEFLYRFQIKEYRFDRFRSGVRDWGWGSLLFAPRLVLPAASVRNLGIGGFLGFFGVVFTCFLYYYSLPVLIGFVLLAPVVALLDVAVLVALTGIPVAWHRERMIKRAERKLAGSQAQVIAVTGSFGKTSVKEFLYTLLIADRKVAKTDKNRNTDVGVALSILKNLKPYTEYFIAEMGAYRIGEIAKICRSFPPRMVVVTAFGNQHLDLYGSKENLVAAESEPLAFLGKGDTAYLNADIPEYRDLTKLGPYRVVSYSMKDSRADIWAEDLTTSYRGTTATIHTPKGSIHLKTKLLGRHTVQNLLPAIAVALDTGLGVEEIREGIGQLVAIPDKGSLHVNAQKTTIYSDASNSNVDGFIELLRIAGTFPQKNRLVVSKGIIELGNEKLPSYRRILKELAGSGCSLLTTDRDFERAGMRRHDVTVFPDEEAIRTALEPMQGKDTLICIEGRFTPGFIRSLH